MTLNCDLGENEPLSQTERLLSLVDAANICCGFHAGSPEKTSATLKLAVHYQVRIGAHPGLVDAGGRGQSLPTADAFMRLLDEQMSAFQAAARACGTAASYIKLHGTLYHAVEAQPELADTYLDFLKRQPDELAVTALAGGRFAQAAEAAGLRVWHEAFADRAYRQDGCLLPRTEPGAILSPPAAIERYRKWRQTGMIATHSGLEIPIKADTLCVHGDSPAALAMIAALRAEIDHP